MWRTTCWLRSLAAYDSQAAAPDGRAPVNGQAAAYLCRRFVCQAPVTTPEALQSALAQL